MGQETELPDKMTLTQAHRYLGISFTKMTKLINEGVIAYEKSRLDHRVKLVKRDDLDSLREQPSHDDQSTT